MILLSFLWLSETPQDLNAHHPMSQPERPFRHSGYEQFSRYNNSQPDAELSNQLGFTQGVDPSSTRSIQPEDEDMDRVDSRGDDEDEDGYVGGHEYSSSDYSSESDEEVEHQQYVPFHHCLFVSVV